MSISDSPKFDYKRLLQDPRWQKKRLKIMERDRFACRVCRDAESTLHVHHRYYKNSEGPWDYPDRALVTLCASCHELYGHGQLSGQDYLIQEILEAGAFHTDLYELSDAFSGVSDFKSSDFIAIAKVVKLYANQSADKRTELLCWVDAIEKAGGVF
jgi:hypothetical protein